MQVVVAEKTYKAGVFTYDFFPVIGGGGKHVHQVWQRFAAGEAIVFSGCRNDLADHRGVLSRWGHGFWKQLLLSIWLNLRLPGLIRRYGLQRINVHIGPGGLFLLRRPAVPLIVTAHHTYTQQSRQVARQFWKRLFIPWERRTLRLASRVICVSEDTRRVVVGSYGIAPEKTEVIPNGIDQAAYFPQPGITKNPKSLFYLSRLEARKGVDFLLRAFRLAAARDGEVHLYLGGKGGLLPSLKEYVAQHDLAGRVTFLGFVPDGELNDWYNRVSCFVMPSVFEGFGIPVIEAMAAGTPVIGTDVDGIRELITSGETGFLVPYGDEEALAEKMLLVANGGFTPPPDLADRIRVEYNWNRIAKEYATLLGVQARD